jgi:hypothetical protein
MHDTNRLKSLFQLHKVQRLTVIEKNRETFENT